MDSSWQIGRAEGRCMRKDMESGVELAPAKLTKTLSVVGLRDDGLHFIESEMVTVSLYDEVKLTADRGSCVISDPDGYISYLEHRFGEIPRDGRNLAVRAAEVLGTKAGLAILKRIPFGAGLGGGSSDAAAVFRLLGKESELALAARIGSDVPFSVIGGRAKVTGVGDIVEPLRFVDEEFLLFLSPILCPTGDVYRRFDDIGGDASTNDLLGAALSVSADLLEVFTNLRKLLGVNIKLAGSGSTFFLDQGDKDVFEFACFKLGLQEANSAKIDIYGSKLTALRVRSVVC